MHKLMRYIKGYEKQALLAPLFKMLEACFELFVPLVIASIIDTGIKNGDATFIWTRCGLLVLLAAVGLASSLTAQWFSATAALGFGTALRKDLYRHIDTLSYSELDGIGTPTLVTRMTSDINQVQNGVNLTLRLLLRSPFIVLGALIMAFSISPKLTLLFVLVTVVISLIIWGIMRLTVPIYHEAQNGMDRVTLLTRENYVGARVVRAFARQADELAAFVETNDHLKKIQISAGRISALMNPLTYLVVNLGVIALLLRGGSEVNNGTLTQGEIIALINYMSQILVNLLRLADLVVSVTRALASGMRVNEILNTHSTMTDPGTAELAADAENAVCFDNVTFTYRGAAAPSLTDISFTARTGETIGIIGGTGSGKSTLIDLICRFYDADNGGVTLFDHDVKQYSFAQLRGLVGIVPQQAVLFTGTIRDNMQWAAPGATDEEIWQALEIAQAAEFVRGKPGMLDAPVETAGRNFSGGQRQRLTIARALVPKPRILILDDSASALDFATDAALRKAIKEKTQGMTVFIVSQRAASVQRADHILVLDDGRLVGDAPHAELLHSCEVYKEICLSQLSKEEVAKTL
ncbi:ABC transporter ATP-binding protein/permease [Gemmiger formicilis]|uniref:ABC transporter ATP-binding protein n=1 Tax=Gemmiger formicilis TaxID=745368 RepID=UPI00210AEC27|nr:ABC transporter ATP-binding protein [Gemmiger formicilis]MCQ5078574.1 ABC transporter ATP-binding protein/permease [Gemmiger formicilis]MCQ5114991.1 ABC transporter ATP-binding protein/permease [Gemmiger formicilis]